MIVRLIETLQTISTDEEGKEVITHQTIEVRSNAFPVNAGHTEVLSMWIKKVAETAGNSNLSVYVFFCDENGTDITDADGKQIYCTLPTAASNADDWTKYIGTFEVPENAEYAYVRFNFHSSDVNTVLVDDVLVCDDANLDHICDNCGITISECADANVDTKCDWCDKVLDDGTPANGDFEYSDTVIAGWKKAGGASVTLVTGAGRDGSNVVRITDQLDKGIAQFECDLFAITGGQKATVSIWIKALEGNQTNSISCWLYFFTEDGAAASTDIEKFAIAATGTDWEEITKTVDVPADAAYARLWFLIISTYGTQCTQR